MLRVPKPQLERGDSHSQVIVRVRHKKKSDLPQHSQRLIVGGSQAHPVLDEGEVERVP